MLTRSLECMRTDVRKRMVNYHEIVAEDSGKVEHEQPQEECPEAKELAQFPKRNSPYFLL